MEIKLLKINVCDWVAYQTQYARKNGYINTRRGIRVPLWMAYRCLYCGEYFNQGGAEAHFGMSREDYNDKPHALSPIHVVEHIVEEILLNWYLKQKEKVSRKDFDALYLGMPERLKDIQKD